jgi:serine/threonine-protein kinase
MSRAPESIGKYRIIELLAEGGMGAVYKGVHPTLDRFIILKKLTLKGNPDFAERFRREAKILMDFRNDNIVDVYDHFKEGRSHYIVLEYIDGLSLEQLIRKERYLPNDVALYIFYHVCKALEYAHKRQVIHRDIKPANILLSRDGDVKLVDFGIASSREDGEEGLTRDGMTLGSPSYMAPEQFENSRNVDKRADIYSLGVMLYESVTGKKPYTGGFSAELIAAISKGRHPSPTRFNPRVSRIIRRIIKKTMHPRRKRRYRDLDPLIRRLERYFRKRPMAVLKEQLRGAVSGRHIKPVKPSVRQRLRRSFNTAFVLVILLAAGGGALYFSGWYQRLVLPGSHGELRLEIRTEKGYKPPEDYYLRAWLFSDTGDDGEDIGAAPIRFKSTEAEGGEDGILRFVSPPLFLPAGEYRIKVQAENAIYWSTFSLRSMQEQSGRRVSSGGRRLLFSLDSRRLPLDVEFFVQDQESWEEIDSRIEVMIDGQWRDWEDNAGLELVTGTVYRFRFSSPGYLSKSFSLLIREDQHSLYLNPKLKKE